MSHHQEIVCPNCGFHATNNYCAQCGQETHLHKDTFWGLVVHFVGHYFHYDSKFWKTIKALLFHPGRLTLAYWNKQRMRYIPPVSLYIFVSALFFLIMFITVVTHENIKKEAQETVRVRNLPETKLSDSLQRVAIRDFAAKLRLKPDQNIVTKRDTSAFKKNRMLIDNDAEKTAELEERLVHSIPKILFFLIPLMAFILKILFFKRKDLHFVQHAIFSIHAQSLVFIAFLVTLIQLPEKDLNVFQSAVYIFQDIVMCSMFLYFVLAIRNVYKTGWIRSVLYTVFISVCYCIAFVMLLGIYYYYLIAHF